LSTGFLVTWQTNRNIQDKEPEKYLAERRDKALLGEREVMERLTSHIIPFDEMISGDYENFLRKRADMIYQAMLLQCESAPSHEDGG